MLTRKMVTKSIHMFSLHTFKKKQSSLSPSHSWRSFFPNSNKLPRCQKSKSIIFHFTFFMIQNQHHHHLVKVVQLLLQALPHTYSEKDDRLHTLPVKHQFNSFLSLKYWHFKMICNYFIWLILLIIKKKLTYISPWFCLKSLSKDNQWKTYCCCAARSICTSGGARAGDSTKWRLGSL
mgnify:CR=1 FL=1